MKPFASIIGTGGVDLMGGLSDRLLSIEVTDEAEEKSDRVTIELDDRARWSDGGMAALPAIGMVVSIVMGYRDGAAASRGSYLIDDIEVSSPPRTLRISGRSAKMPNSFRTPRVQSYHQQTLGEIAEEVAGRNGYSAVVDSALAGIVVRHIDQHNESDMAFVSRLAAQHDGVGRPVDGKLVLAKRGTGKAISGAPLPTIMLRESDCETWSFKYSARDEAGESGGMEGEGGDQQGAGDAGAAQSASFDAGALGVPGGGKAMAAKGGVRSMWTDIRTGERKEVTVGQAPFHDLRYSFHNEAEAEAAASSYMNQAQRGKASFSCTIGGKPAVQAEAVLLLAAFRPYIPLAWRITSAVHRFDGGGYTTAINAELFQKEQGDVPAKVAKTKPTDDDLIDPAAPPEPVKSAAPSGGNIIRLPGEVAP